jgi:hypothetical protein
LEVRCESSLDEEYPRPEQAGQLHLSVDLVEHVDVDRPVVVELPLEFGYFRVDLRKAVRCHLDGAAEKAGFPQPVDEPLGCHDEKDCQEEEQKVAAYRRDRDDQDEAEGDPHGGYGDYEP